MVRSIFRDYNKLLYGISPGTECVRGFADWKHIFIRKCGKNMISDKSETGTIQSDKEESETEYAAG